MRRGNWRVKERSFGDEVRYCLIRIVAWRGMEGRQTGW